MLFGFDNMKSFELLAFQIKTAANNFFFVVQQ